MMNAINWKPYVIVSVLVSLTLFFFIRDFAIGFALGTIVYFINLFLSSKKFPRIDAKPKVIVKAILVMLVEGILIAAMAIASYKLFGLRCFLASFVGMIIPNIYFFILGIKTK